MSQSATAIYENGVLRLLSPLDLPERARVHILIESVEPATELPATAATDPDDEREITRRILIEAGLVRPEPIPFTGIPLSEQELEELADRIAGAGPLSDLIIEERREGP